jgi:hypothetical protein
VAPWGRENSQEAYPSGCEGVAAALKTWRDSRKGRRRGRRAGFPRFRKRKAGGERRYELPPAQSGWMPSATSSCRRSGGCGRTSRRRRRWSGFRQGRPGFSAPLLRPADN